MYCEYHSYDFLLNRHFTQSKLSPKNYRDKSKYSNGLIEEINFITFEKYPPMLEYEADKIKEDCIILRWSGKLCNIWNSILRGHGGMGFPIDDAGSLQYI